MQTPVSTPKTTKLVHLTLTHLEQLTAVPAWEEFVTRMVTSGKDFFAVALTVTASELFFFFFKKENSTDSFGSLVILQTLNYF